MTSATATFVQQTQTWLSTHLDDAYGIDTAIRSFWAYLMNNYHHSLVTVVFPFIILVAQYAFMGGVMYLLEYTIKWPWLLKHKIQKKTNSDALNWKAFKVLVMTYFLVILPLYGIGFFYIFRVLAIADAPEAIPSWYIIILQILFCMFTEDLSHYWAHRWMHIKWFYNKVHYLHHEFQAPNAMSASYAHPLEVIIEGTAAFSGPLLLRPHFLVMLTWILLRQAMAVETHCGFDFPFSPNNILPFFGGASFHDYHHRTYNGIYSSNFVWWDVLFGTDGGYFDWKKKQEAKKEKAAAALSEQPGESKKAK